MSMIGNYRRVNKDDLAALQADPAAVPDFLYEEDPPPDHHLEIDKTWHAIHFLLNGTTWEGTGAIFDAILGGEVLGEEDVGYGPARFLTPKEVKATATALNEISIQDLMEKFDAHELNDNDIYPQHWTGHEVDVRYVTDNFARLVRFFQLAANSGDAMLLYIN